MFLSGLLQCTDKLVEGAVVFPPNGVQQGFVCSIDAFGIADFIILPWCQGSLASQVVEHLIWNHVVHKVDPVFLHQFLVFL